MTNALRGDLFWVFPIGRALGIGRHLADALPDAEADAAGTRGLAQALGRAALPVCWSAFVVAAGIVAALAVAHPLPVRRPALIVLEVLSLALVAAAVISFRQSGSDDGRWRVFQPATRSYLERVAALGGETLAEAIRSERSRVSADRAVEQFIRAA